MLKILGRKNSINVRKVLWLADELGLDYEQEDWGRGFRDAKEPEYLKLNPTGMIPTLIDGEQVIWESHTIMRHLATKYDQDGKWYPQAPSKRPEVEQWLDWLLGWPSTYTAIIAQGRFLGVEAMQDPVLQSYAERGLKSIIDWTGCILEARQSPNGPTGGSGYLVGQAPTLADIPLGLYVNRWALMLDEAKNSAPLQAYLERLATREHNQRYSGPDQF